MTLPSKLDNLSNQSISIPVFLKGFVNNIDVSKDEVKFKECEGVERERGR